MEIYVFTTLLILILSQVNNANAECGICQKNGVACIGKSSYQLCFGGSRPYLKQNFSCIDGFHCTDLPNICFQRGGWTPSCGDLSNCFKCDANRVFACTSRTEFVFCFGSALPTNVKGTCPIGLVCDLTSSFICVPFNHRTKLSCDIA